MASIILTVKKADVWEEVAKVASYAGDKIADADGATYDRILMTDDDQANLQRFWEESVAASNSHLREMLGRASEMADDYEVELHQPNNYKGVLTPSVEASLRGYFVASITGRWFRLANKEEAEAYMSEAANLMEDVLRKLYTRRRPRRTTAESVESVDTTGEQEEKEACCCKRSGRARRREKPVWNRLVFYREELLQDIENYSFVTADIMPSEDEHDRHQVFDVAQEGNGDLATRVLNLAYAECVELLYPYTKNHCREGEEYDDRLRVPERYEIGLALPEDFSRTTVRLLRELVHDYLVCRVLTEWLGITYPDVLPLWRDRLEDIRGRLRRGLLGRRKPLRRGQSMF